MKNVFLKASTVLSASLVASCSGAQKKVYKISYPTNKTSAVEGAVDHLVKKGGNLRSVKHITDGGPVTDKSFNQTIFKGLQDYNGTSIADGAVIPNNGSSVDEFISLYQKTLEKTQIIVAGGFQHTNALTKYGKDIPEDRGIIFVDGEVKAKNINSIVFNIEEAAFFAGYATSEWLSKNNEKYKEDGLKVGTFGGRNFPTVTCFMSGFQQGVTYWNNNLPSNGNKVEFIKLGTKVEDYFSGSFEVGKGKSISQKLLSKGADVILPVAGPQTGDTLAAIKEKKSNALVVGVDTDQVKQYSDHSNTFLTSILKNMDLAVTRSLKHIFSEKIDTLDNFGLGKTTVGNWANGLVGIASGGDNKISEADLERLKKDGALTKAASSAINQFML